MGFEAGDEVIVRGTDLVGSIVKRRIEGEDTYLVRIERFYNESSLQSMSDADKERKGSESLSPLAPEMMEEWVRLGQLTQENLRDGKLTSLSEPMKESMRKLGLIKNSNGCEMPLLIE